MGKSSMALAHRGGGLDTTKYALIYPRQSTGEQVEHNIYSLERQMQLKERALRDGFSSDLVVVIDDDLGLSGRSIEARPGFTRALKMMAQGVVAAIYVEDLTRLSRDERTIDQMVIADACEQAGALIYMGGSWYDMRDSGQRQSYKYQAVGASEYWKAHVQKLHETKRQKAMEGKAVTRVPKGYRVNREGGRKDPNRDRLMVYEPEAEVIRSLMAKLPQAGSLKALYRQTYPTYWPDGSVVTWGKLRTIAKDPTYRGTYVWGNIVVPDAHEAIIPSELAVTIDELLKLNQTSRKRETKRPGGVLAGLVWCPACKTRMHTHAGNHKPDYRCGEDDNPVRKRFHFSVLAGLVDDLVLTALWRRLEGGLIDCILNSLHEAQAHQTKIIDLGEANRAAVQRRIDGLVRRLSHPDLEELAEKVLIQQLNEATRELEALTRAPVSGPTLLADVAFYEELRRKPELLAALPATWKDEPMHWRRGWLRRFVTEVAIARPNSGRFNITITWKDGTNEVLHLTTRAGLTSEEKAIIRKLWHHPDRPGRDWCKWIQAGLAAAGYERSPQAIYRAVPIALKDGRAVSEEERAFLLALWHDHERPEKNWVTFFQDRMANVGYHRSRKALYQLMPRLLAGEPGGVDE